MKAMKIRLFTTPDCPFSKKARAFLREHKMEFENNNVLEDEDAREEMIKSSQQMAVPVIEIEKSDGVEMIIGYDEEKIKEALNLKEIK
jgi:glutaredoxin 3